MRRWDLYFERQGKLKKYGTLYGMMIGLAWLLNLFISMGPFESFAKLKEAIQLPEYRKAKFTFLRD